MLDTHLLKLTFTQAQLNMPLDQPVCAHGSCVHSCDCLNSVFLFILQDEFVVGSVAAF